MAVIVTLTVKMIVGVGMDMVMGMGMLMIVGMGHTVVSMLVGVGVLMGMVMFVVVMMHGDSLLLAFFFIISQSNPMSKHKNTPQKAGCLRCKDQAKAWRFLPMYWRITIPPTSTKPTISVTRPG